MKSNYHKALQELHDRLDGDVESNPLYRYLYANDASIYQQKPIGVAYPKNKSDCEIIVQFANRHKLGLIPRGGGTSLAGQVVGDGLVVDVSKHMTQISHIDTTTMVATVQPGVIPATLNAQLEAKGLMFAPDPSTLDRCTISGLIGNNAWGAHAPIYGTTSDHIVNLDVVLANGTPMHVAQLDHDQLQHKLALADNEGDIYRFVHNVIEENKTLIHHRYPKGTPSNMGYALDTLSSKNSQQASNTSFSLIPLICGSEGSLALITNCTVRLSPLPKLKKLVCAHYNSLEEALESVVFASKYAIAAIELLDKTILDLTLHNRQHASNRSWIEGSPEAVLLIEFYAEDEKEIDRQVHELINQLSSEKLGYCYPILNNINAQKAWAIRRAGLGLLMGLTTTKKAVTFIEDSAVPVPHLAAFVKQTKSLFQKHKIKSVYYGSVSMGLIHIRPFLDLHLDADQQKLVIIENEIAEILKTYGGSLSAKHGDGRLRSQFIQAMLGDDLYGLMKSIKSQFDPNNLLNPNKLFDQPNNIEHLRLSTSIEPQTGNFQNNFRWSNENGLINAIEQCNGAGACRKITHEATMCPSYKATHEEKLSTRARANVFRQVVQEEGLQQGIKNEHLHEVLSTCLSCKACHRECPANVDMAKLKSVHLQHYHQYFGYSVRQRLIQFIDKTNKLSQSIAPLINRITRSNKIKKIFSIATQRTLPVLQQPNLLQWHQSRPSIKRSKSAKNVVFFSDLFTTYYEPHIGKAAIQSLEIMGFNVIVTPCFPSLRTVISQGMLKSAKKRLKHICHWMQNNSKDYTIIGIEPSEALSYRDEIQDLLLPTETRKQLESFCHRIVLFDEFIKQQLDKAPLPFNPHWTDKIIKIKAHLHCHQKALTDTSVTLDILNAIPLVHASMIEAGCCGMAGFFGYEKEHYDLSLKIAEQALLPEIRATDKDTIVVATGTSCRSQISHISSITALHPAELIYQSLTKDS